MGFVAVGNGACQMLSVMQTSMFTVSKHFKILWTVVQFIVVYMMYMLARFQRATKNLFHYNSMLKNLFSIVHYDSIAKRFTDRAGAVRRSKQVSVPVFPLSCPMFLAEAISVMFSTTSVNTAKSALAPSHALWNYRKWVAIFFPFVVMRRAISFSTMRLIASVNITAWPMTQEREWVSMLLQSSVMLRAIAPPVAFSGTVFNCAEIHNARFYHAGGPA